MVVPGAHRPRGDGAAGPIRPWLLYKLVLTKNKLAASDEVISFRIYDPSYSQIGFNQYVIKKMVDGYSYVCVLNHCHTSGRA